MSVLNISAADTLVSDATALVPTTVPDSWLGTAATACQTDLDYCQTLLTGLQPLLEAARSAVAALDDASVQCGAVQ